MVDIVIIKKIKNVCFSEKVSDKTTKDIPFPSGWLRKQTREVSTWFEDRLQRGREHTTTYESWEWAKGAEQPVFQQRQGRGSELSRGVEQCVCVQRN